MRPIAILAIAILAAFFMPWITVTVSKGPKGLEAAGSVTGLDMALHVDKFDQVFGGTASKSLGNINISIWFWALPALALATALTAGKGLPARCLGLFTGLYPFGWLTFGYLKVPGDKRSEVLKELGDHFSSFVGVGAYVILLGSLLLVILSLAGVGASTEEE